MAVKNLPASVLDRLRNQAKAEGITFQMALQLFFQEEFLRKLSVSPYADNLVLKGGMFIYTLTEFDSRPTRDIDFLMQRLSNDLGRIEQIMKEICNTPSDNDFIRFEVTGSERITPDKKYPGIRTRFLGRINNVKVPFSIDIGVDDVIIPDASRRKIPTRLPDFESPEIYTYSLESTIAEKLDAILQRMETTSRMKDFYDIYYLSGMFDFDGGLLHKALKTTLLHRGRTADPQAFEKILHFNESHFLNTQWKAFEPARSAGLSFDEVLSEQTYFCDRYMKAF